MSEVPAQQFELRRYLRGIRRHKGLAGIVFAAVFVLSLVAAYLWPPQYSSRALVAYLPEAEQSVLFDRPVQATSAAAKDQIELVKGLMFHPNVLRRAIDESGLNATIPLAFSDTGYAQLSEDLQKDVQIVAVSKNVIRVAYRSKDRQVAFKVVQTLVDQFIEGVVERKRGEATRAIRFIENQLRDLRRVLDEKGREIARFRSANEEFLFDAPRNHKVVLAEVQDRLSELEMQLQTANERLTAYRTQVEARRQFLTDNPQAGALDPFLETLQSQLLSVRVALFAAQRRYQPNSPVIEQLQQEQARLEEAIQEERERVASEDTERPERSEEHFAGDEIFRKLETDRFNAELDVRALETRIAYLRNRRTELTDAVARMPDVQRRYDELVREQDVNHEEYKEYLARLAEAQLREAVAGAREANVFQVLASADLPLLRDVSVPLKIAGAGSFLGLMLAVALVAGLTYFDASVSDIDEARLLLHLPSLGTVPEIRTEGELRRRRRRIIAAVLVGALVLAGAVVVCVMDESVRTRLLSLWEQLRFFVARSF